MAWIDLGGLKPDTQWQFLEVSGYDYFKVEHTNRPKNITAYIARIQQYVDGSFEAYDIQPIFGFSDIEVYKVRRTHSPYGTAIGIRQKYGVGDWGIGVSAMDANDYSIELEDLRNSTGSVNSNNPSSPSNPATNDMWIFNHEDVLVDVSYHSCIAAPSLIQGNNHELYQIIYQGKLSYNDLPYPTPYNVFSFNNTSFDDIYGDYRSSYTLTNGTHIDNTDVNELIMACIKKPASGFPSSDYSGAINGQLLVSTKAGKPRTINGFSEFQSSNNPYAFESTYVSGAWLNLVDDINSFDFNWGNSTFTGRITIGHIYIPPSTL